MPNVRPWVLPVWCLTLACQSRAAKSQDTSPEPQPGAASAVASAASVVGSSTVGAGRVGSFEQWDLALYDGRLSVVPRVPTTYRASGLHLEYQLTADHRVLFSGKLTDGSSTVLKTWEPQPVPGLAEVKQLSAGARSICALQNGGRLSCVQEIGVYDEDEPTPRDLVISQPLTLASDGVTRVYQAQQVCYARNGTIDCVFLEPKNGNQLEVAERNQAPVKGVEEFCVMQDVMALSGCAKVGEELVCWGNDSPASEDRSGKPRVVPMKGTPARLLCGEESLAVVAQDGSLWYWSRRGFEPDAPLTKAPHFPAAMRATLVSAGGLCALDTLGDLHCCGNVLGTQAGSDSPPACVPQKIAFRN